MAGLLGDVLPWVYSQGDRAKRYVGGLLSDPIGSLEQTAGQIQDYRREDQRLNAKAFADPANPFRVTNRQALGTLADRTMAVPMGLAPAGITAWHGTPQIFDNFAADKAGSVGGTSFGMGHNFSANPAHAKVYAGRSGGNMYKVDIADDAVDGFMKWERPLADQPAGVREVVGGLPTNLPDRMPFGGGAEMVRAKDGWRLVYGESSFPMSEREIVRMFGNQGTGEQTYRKLVAHLGSEKAANEALRKAGVRGIENNTEHQSRNFVVFPGEEGLLKILERNGQPLK